jgi:hypothetical protein
MLTIIYGNQTKIIFHCDKFVSNYNTEVCQLGYDIDILQTKLVSSWHMYGWDFEGSKYCHLSTTMFQVLQSRAQLRFY